MATLSSRRPFLPLLVAFLLMNAGARAQSIKTPAEENGYSRYTQHEEVARFLQSIARAAREVKVQAVGSTDPAKDFPGAKLYLCVITAEGAASPSAIQRRKPTILLFAAQHGNEQSGKEAALALIRDLALGELKPLLGQMNFLIIPQANPHGNFANRRQNEQNLDLNRDHIKLEAPETRAIHGVFRSWMPEVTLDVHEKGDDYYRVSTGCVSNLNISESLQRYSRERLFPEVETAVAADGFTWHEYLVTDTVGSASAAGVPDRPETTQGRETLMRFSTTDLNDGRNSPGIYETLSFIQEGASRHDIPTLEARTRWQQSGIRALIRAVAAHRGEVLSLVRKNRAALLRRARKPAAGDVVHLRMEYVRDPKEPQLTLKRFARSKGAPAAAEPAIETVAVKNWYPAVQSRLSVPRPLGYVVPAAHEDVVKNLRDHGIAAGRFTRDATIAAETWHVREVVPSNQDYVAPEKLEAERRTETISVRKGDYYVAGDQPAANLIPSLLEPQSEYGLIRYQAFKLVPVPGSVFPISRVVRKQKLPLAPAGTP